MATIIQSPEKIRSISTYENVKLYIGGEIDNESSWQDYVISELCDVEGLSIFNPKPKKDCSDKEEQLIWEFDKLEQSNVILFWISDNSDNALTLYNMGFWLASDTPIIIGIDPKYKMCKPLQMSLRLHKPGMIVYDNLSDMIEMIKNNIVSINDL